MSDSYSRRKRSVDSHHHHDGERETKRPYIGSKPLLKLLVPNYVAGALIGKGGCVLNELKEKYGGYIRLSGGREYYPGTEERVIVITGELHEIIDLNNYIIEKVNNPGRDSSMKNVEIDENRSQTVRIVLTDAASGLLIGRAGATIKGIQEESKAKVSVQMPTKVTVPGERILTIGGTTEERVIACALVIKVVSHDASNMQNTKTKYNTPMPYGLQSPMRGGGNPTYGGGGGMRMREEPIVLPVSVIAEVTVPSELVGGILGKQGSVIREMAHTAHARLRFEEPADKDDGTRTLTIKGNMEQAAVAYRLVMDRVVELKRSMMD